MTFKVSYPERTEKNLDDVKCLHCGHIGLTSTNHCKKCYGDHVISIEMTSKKGFSWNVNL